MIRYYSILVVDSALSQSRVSDADASQTYSAGWRTGDFALAQWHDNNNQVCDRVAPGGLETITLALSFAGTPDEYVEFFGQVDFGSPYQIWDNDQLMLDNPGNPAQVGPPSSGEVPGLLWRSNYLLAPGPHTFQLRKLPSDDRFAGSDTSANQRFFYDGYRVASRVGLPAANVPAQFYPPGTSWEENDAGKWTFSGGPWDLVSGDARYSGGNCRYMNPGTAGYATLDKPVRGAGIRFSTASAGNEPLIGASLEIRPYTTAGTGQWVVVGSVGGYGAATLLFVSEGYYDIRVGKPADGTRFTVLDALTVV